VVVDVNVIFKGKVQLGDNVSIGANCIISDSVVSDGVNIKDNSLIEGAEIGAKSQIGPFARLRPGSVIGEGSQIGNFVELKQVKMGKGCKINHHSFVGDCVLGDNVVLGAGFISCNHDGFKVSMSEIGDHAYIGSGVQLVAPVKVGHNSFIGAGSTITEDVPEKTLALSRSKQVIIRNWKRKSESK
jgi:bifunctional UDP-N-acetylglucosamine pyrophosphorylase / glucosamine-1-phosphate N-acetyltransferase